MLSALHSALAPDVPLIVDFRHHWGHFIRYYSEHKPLSSKSQPVEKTHQAFHVRQMVKILAEEHEQTKADTLGPCLEYLINRQMLDVFSSLCQADSPPGIRTHLIHLFVFLVSKINSVVLLPYVNVYLPMRRLLLLSAACRASPTEQQELQFTTALGRRTKTGRQMAVSKLKNSPELLPLFAHHAKPGDVSHCSSRRSSCASSLVDLSAIEQLASPGRALLEQQEEQSRHLIVSALINFIDSADYMISVKAMDALLLVCSFPDPSAASNAVDGTPLCAFVTKRLTRLFEAVPMDADLAMVEEVRVNWVEAHHLHSHGSKLPDFAGKSELVSFYSWLDFTDNLIKSSTPIISEALSEAVREVFLEKCLEVNFNQIMAERDAEQEQSDPPITIVRLLALITQCWVHVNSEGLASEFSSWLLGADPSSPSPSSPRASEPELRDVVTHPLKHSLLSLCRADTQEIALEALRLFEVVLERPCDPILQGLVLSCLSRRGYCNAALAESSISSWSDEEDEREKAKTGQPGIELSPTRSTRSSSSSPSRLLLTNPSRTLAPTNIARVVNAWLYLVPDDLRGAAGSDAARDSGYDGYVRNAEVQVAEAFKRCGGFRWPREATFPDDMRCSEASSDSRTEVDADQARQERRFFEGEFLCTLFDLLDSLLERDYDVNLQVTALLARLACLPHPYAHEYLLNPTVPCSADARTLYRVLQRVLARARDATAGVEGLGQKIVMCKKTLLGSEADRAKLNLTKRETRVIDGLIVVEEFGKELAAIALVKYHLAAGE